MSLDERVIKCVVVGNSNVGKTSLMDRLVRGETAACPHATIGVECRVIHLPERRARVRFWDTAGMEQFDAITKLYYRGVDCAIVCYSEQDDSIQDVARWVERIRQEHDGVSRKTRRRIEANCCEERGYVMLDDDEGTRTGSTTFPSSGGHQGGPPADVLPPRGGRGPSGGPLPAGPGVHEFQDHGQEGTGTHGPPLRQDDGYGARDKREDVEHRRPRAEEHPVLPVDVTRRARGCIFFPALGDKKATPITHG